MRINFYKLFFTFLFIMISGVGFAQTTVTFEGSGYTTGTENYHGQSLDFTVSGRTLRFNYNNASTTTSSGGTTSTFYLDNSSGTNTSLGAFNASSSDILKISFTDQSLFSFNSLKILDYFGFNLTIKGYRASALVATATYSGDSNATFSTVNTLTQDANFNNVDEVRITGGSGVYNLFDDVVIQATASIPTVTTTTPATNILAASATLAGNVTGDGGATLTAKGVVYGPSLNPAIGGSGVVTVPASGTTVAPFTVSATSLTANTQYHYRAYATNSVGTAYGTDQTFTTAATPAATVTSVTSSTANNTYKAGSVISIQVNFSSAVTVTGTPQLQLSTGTTNEQATYSGTGSGTTALTFNYTVQPGDNTTDLDYLSTTALTLNGGTITNGGTNTTLTLPAPAGTGSLGANKDIVIDTQAPQVSSINRANTNPTVPSTTVNFTVTFSEPVTGVDQLDFTLAQISSSDATIASLTAVNSKTYTVTINTGTHNGIFQLNLNASGTGIADLVGNVITTGFTGQNYTVTAPAATVASVNSSTANGTYKAGDAVSIQVNFSEAVTVTGTPQLQLSTGTTNRTINYSGTGSGTTALTFNYTVQAGDISPDLDYVGTGSLTLNSGTILNNAGTATTLTLPIPGTTGSLGANKAIVIDTQAPTATLVMSDAALKAGETSLLTITFSEAVSGLANNDLTIANGTLSPIASSDGGITWTATFTPTAGITAANNVITLNNTGIADAAGNTGTGTTPSNNYAIDTQRPTATLVMADAALKAGETSLLTITFNKAVSGLANNDLTIANGTLSPISSSDGGITWTATFTPTAGITAANNVITLNNTGIADAAGNTGTGTTPSNVYDIDTQRPTATLVMADAALKAGETSLLTITFSEAVSGLANNDLTIANGTLSPIASSDGGITWTATFTPTAGITAANNVITLNNTGVADVAGNTGTGTTPSNNYAIDTQRPTATLVMADAALKAGETSLLTITFNKAVSGLANNDLTIANGTLSPISSSDGGITWTATFTPTAGITAANNVISLNNTGIADAAGNTGTGTTPSNVYDIDTQRPTATLVMADAALKAGETSLLTITFSEAVSGLANNDLTIANGTLSPIASSDGGITWTATFTPTAGITAANNVITLNNTGIADVAGNTGTGTTPSNVYDIDTQRPTATLVMADAALKAGETSLLTITFSEAVSGLANNDLTIANGTLSPIASSDGGITWTATFTPTAGITAANNVITLNNTGIADVAGNTGTGTTPSNNYAIDTQRPTATLVMADAALKAGETSLLTITFNKAVSGLANNDLTIANGTLSPISSSDGGITWTATFTPTAGITAANNVISLNNTGIADAAGNTGTGTTPSNVYDIDTQRPTATLVMADAALKAGETSLLTITFSEAVSGLANNDLTIANGTLSPISSSDGGLTWTATFTPTAGITAANNVITLNNTGIADVAGNTGTGTTPSNNYAIDTQAPLAPVVSTPANGATVITATPAINGTAEAGSVVTVNIDGSVVSTVVPTDGTGNWTYTASSLLNGSHTVKALATDVAGNAGVYSNTNTFTVNVDPTITATGTLSALTTTYGTASSPSSFTVSGINMTAGILVTPPSGFEVSTDNTTFSNTVTAGSAGVISQVVYVRLKNTAAANTYSGSNIILSSAGATNVTKAIPTSTVSPLAITVTADAKSKTYGDNDPGFTYAVTTGALVNSDTFTGTLTRGAGEAVNAYAITQGTLTPGNNYAVTYVPANLTIGTRPVTVTADAKSKIYGDADPALTYTITAGTLAYTDAFTGALTRDAGEAVNNYAITQNTLTLGSNYALTYVPANLTIGTRAVTVTADAKSKTYGDADPALTYTITAGTLAFTDAFTGALTRDAGEAVNTYAITQNTLTLGSNYALTYVPANLTIGTRAVTVTADAKSKTYGDADPALTYTITAGTLAFTDAFTGALTRDAGETVNTYAITQNTLTLGSNYALTYVPANLTISTRAVTVTADAKSKTYGDADPALTYTITAGTLAYTDAFTGALTRDAGEAVNTYAITQNTLTLGSNYALTYVPANLTIGTRAVTVTADAKSKTYGDADPALTYTITAGTLAYTDAFTGALTRDAGEAVNTYAITQGSLTLGSNYALTYVPANLTIGTRAVTVTADAKSKTYGDADPALTYAITAGTLAGTDAFTGALTRDAGENVNTYAITQNTLTLGSNYALTYVPANLTIGTRAVTVTADAKSKTYGDADPALTYAITAGTLAYTDAFTGALTRDAGEIVNTYAITQGTLTLGSNYALTYVPANLTIGTRAVTVTADAKSKVYGTADPALTYTITTGTLAGSDAFTGTLTRVAGENINTYAITQGTLALNSNYALTYVPANLIIGTRAVTVTADAKSKVYGAADPALTYAITSGTLVGTDAFTGTLTRNPGENVNTYAITQGTLALSSNYALTYVPANLTIGTRAITVTADAKSKVYGAADPALTYAITTGTLAGSDAFTGALVRDAGENINTYAIKQGTLALNSNYVLTYAGANLTITKRVLTITADNQSKVYGSANPALTVNYSGFATGESQSNLTAQPVISTTATTGSGANTYPITVSGAAIPNYDIVYVPGTLTVNKAVLTVIADKKSRNYGVDNPQFTVTYNGFVNGDDATKLSAQAVASSNTIATSAPGDYPITVNGAASANYSFNYVNGTLTIIPLNGTNVSNLTISSGTLSPAFASGTHTYTTSVDNGSGNVSFTITFDPTAKVKINGQTAPNGSPSIGVPLNVGNNTITIVVTAQDGVTTNTYTVTVYRGEPAAAITATNILTPNGDGKNDTWVIQDIQLYPKNSVTVYDRAGRTVYTKQGYSNDWDGTLKGAPLTEGTYYYTVDLGPGLPKFRGFITLLRSN